MPKNNSVILDKYTPDKQLCQYLFTKMFPCDKMLRRGDKMSYTQLLNQIIEKSSLTLKEIAERCTEDGVKITSSYISTLRNDTNNRAPSDDVSRAIAKACGSKHIDILVVENYIANAPESLKKIFESIREIALIGSMSAIQNEFSEEEIQYAKTIIDQMPLGEFLLNFADMQTVDIVKAFGMMNLSAQFHDKDEGYDVNAQLKNAVGIEINDDSMFPIIPKGSKAVFEIKEIKDFADGDIIAFIEKDNENILIFRKIIFLNKEHSIFAMFPVNSEYETKTYSIDDVTILGRVCQIITDL